jgi:hypothetical protein
MSTTNENWINSYHKTQGKAIGQFARDSKILLQLESRLHRILIQRDWHDGGVGSSYEFTHLENGDLIITRIVDFTGTNEAGERVANKYEIYTDGTVVFLMD